MKMLLCSDLHYDKRTLGVSRYADVCAAVDQTVEAAVREKVSLYACLGDITDPDAGPVVLRAAEHVTKTALTLRAEGIDSVWLAGNHDVFEDSSGDTSLAPLRPFQGMLPGTGRSIIAERPTTFELAEWTVICLPYVATSHTYDPAKYVEENHPGPREKTLILGHLHLPNMHPGEESIEMARGRELMFPIAAIADLNRTYAFGGHYHKAGVFSGVHIVGSLVAFTFGEENHKATYTIVDLEDM